jgi:hypothetical protein
VKPDAPRFFMVGETPVKFVAPPGGGLTVRRMDPKSGVFVYGMEFYALALSSDPNVDEVDEQQFIQIVESKRAALGAEAGPLGALYAKIRAIEERAVAAQRALSPVETAKLGALKRQTYAQFQAAHPDVGP